MKFLLMQTLWKENEDFEIYRDNIGEQYIFIHLLTPVIASLKGMEIKISPGGCVFFGMNSPQYFRTDGTKLVHDWFHADPSCGELMKKYGIECETVYYPQNSGNITKLLSEIEVEYLNRDRHYEDAVNILAEKLFITLSRAESKNRGTPDRREDIINARTQIHSNPAYPWTTEAMAKLVNLSSSRFYALYKSYFGTTPQNDLINTRIQAAARLLMHSNYTVERVAEQTGYTNIYHFIRQFKKIIGQTPGEYKKMSHENQTV